MPTGTHPSLSHKKASVTVIVSQYTHSVSIQNDEFCQSGKTLLDLWSITI